MIMTGPRNDWVVIDGWLRGSAYQIYRWISMDQKERGRRRSTLNCMLDMRRAFGLDPGPDGIPDWLRYWASLTGEQRELLRRTKLLDLVKLDIPLPEGVADASR